MRILLSVLLCFVLLRSECFALHVSHESGGGIPVNVVGSYAGVLLPFDPNEVSKDINDPAFIAAFNAANVLAVFTFTVPGAGLAKGDIVLFAAGRTYVGTITGFADGDTGRIFATIDAEFLTEENNNIILIDFAKIAASGRMAAIVSQFGSFGFSSGLGRLSGKAHIDATTTDEFTVPITVTTDGTFDLFIDGVKQT